MFTKIVDSGKVDYYVNGGAYNSNGYFLHPSLITGMPKDVGIGKVGTAVEGAAKVSGWIERAAFKSLDGAIQKKVVDAVKNGIVAPTGRQGIIRLTAFEATQTGYLYKIKILGKGGDIRIYGNPQANGHIFFDKVMRH